MTLPLDQALGLLLILSAVVASVDALVYERRRR